MRLLPLVLSLLPTVLSTPHSGSHPEPHPPRSTNNAVTTVSIAALKAAGFKGSIDLPGSAAYTNATDAWALNYKEVAQVALEPTSTSDVQIAIKWVNQFSLDFAIRSGGRSTSQSNQVVIALDKLNKIQFDSANNVFHLGPGQTWGDVYTALAGQSHTVLGGRVPFVGVGGFTLGGGISYLQNLHGLASDSIVDATVVLADGSVKQAASDPNLLYAVRGAGFTIGAVTELVVKAYPVPPNIFSGFILVGMDQFETVKANVANMTATNTDPNVSMLLGSVFTGGAQLLLVFPIVYGTEAFAKSSAVGWAWKLQNIIQDTTAVVDYQTLNNLQLAFVHHPAPTSNYQQHSVTVSELTADVIEATINGWQTPLLSDPRWQGLAVLFEPFIPGAFTKNPSGPWPRRNTQHVIQIFIEQLNATDPGDMIENTQQLQTGASIIEKAAGPSNLAGLGRYTNYYLQGTPAQQFFLGNLPKLQHIKKQFDPTNRFNKMIAITPA